MPDSLEDELEQLHHDLSRKFIGALLVATFGGLVALAVLAIRYKSHNDGLNVVLLVAIIVSLGVAVPAGVCAGRFARRIGRLTKRQWPPDEVRAIAHDALAEVVLVRPARFAQQR